MTGTIETVMVPGPPELALDVARPRSGSAASGPNPPVVFLHGIGGNRTNWTRQLEALGDRFWAMAWDARGYGDSADVDGPRQFTDFAQDLARTLDHLKIERAHLVGLSMGARILMTFFPRYRERVETLTLCDCFGGYRAMSGERRREFLELREKPLLSGKTFADLAPRLVDSLVSPTCPESVRAELHASIVALRVEPYLKTLRATTMFDETGSLATIDVPVQLIFGADDRLTPPANGDKMVDAIPDARLAIIPGAGHLSNLEAPVEFNRILTAFLAAHS